MAIARVVVRSWVAPAILALLAGAGRAETSVRVEPELNDVISLVPVEYRHQLIQQLSQTEDKEPKWLAAIAAAPAEQREGWAFLLTNMPDDDLKSLTPEFVAKDIDLAYKARASSAWAAAVPKEIFLNDVLPYSNLNERRDDWRGDFVLRFSNLVKNAKNPGEAAQILNRAVFKNVKVSYHATKRKKPDQSPYESMEIGYASCSGLSILLVDACRAVGVPARVAGTPLWYNKSGNHTWTEVWDGQQWRYVGSAEPGDFNKTWFSDLAAKAEPSNVETHIFAASFAKTELPFPMVWLPDSKAYPAVDVTAYYLKRAALKVQADAVATVQVFEGDRLVGQSTGPASFDLAVGGKFVVVGPTGQKQDVVLKDGGVDVVVK